MAKYFLGIDGGQSSTTALIGDEAGSVVGHGRGGPCNHVKGPEGRTKFLNAINGCVDQARGSIERSEITSICGGFSGGPADKEALLREMFPESRVLVTGDMLTALTGAIGNNPGIIANAGTGSFAYGRNTAGKTARAGGWGYIFGDEASGLDQTRQALRAALRHEEGWGPATMLTELLLAETGAVNANDLLHRFYTTDWPRPKIAALSRLVDQAAQEGDAIAQDILHAAAQQLAGYTSAVRGMLFQRGDTAYVSWAGGAFKSEILLLRYRTIVELEDGNLCQLPKYGPAAGALLEAYRQAGITATLVNVPELEK